MLELRFGLSFEDLHHREGLERLDAAFLDFAAETHPELRDALLAGRANPASLSQHAEAELLIALAPQLEEFLARLFAIEAESRALSARHHELAPLYAVKRAFVQRIAIGKVKAAGEGVLAIPKRAKMAAGAVGKLTVKAPSIALKATTHLKNELKAATDDMKVQLQANLEMVPKLTADVKGMVPDAVGKIKAIPTESAGVITELKAAFAGNGSFPKIAGGASASAGGEAGGEAVAGAEGEGEGAAGGEGDAAEPAA